MLAQTGSIKGKVLLVNGEPAVYANIQLEDGELKTITNEAGTFSMQGLKPGTYQIHVSLLGHESTSHTLKVPTSGATPVVTIRLIPSATPLNEVVVTGQYEPQSLRKSVYQIRTISSERIQQRGAVNVMGVLNNELGMRFSNDATLGTTDVQLMGMSGRNVKILLDGVPMVDRGDTRESLNQIDINSIERIEIVEGPMSVSYGSDALAGVINIITKKATGEHLGVTARLQEETVGQEYQPLTQQGTHNQSLGLTWQKKGWQVAVGGTNNTFGGWQGRAEGRTKEWLPKDQRLGHVKVGYVNGTFSVYYRLDGLMETILSEGAENINTQRARDQKYLTNRLMHQLQGEWTISERVQLTTQASYTDYERRTQTSILDLTTGRRTLSLGQGEQDVAKFDSKTFRTTLSYKLSSAVSLQPGVDINLDAASGARIAGTPSISDYALFISSVINPTSAISIRPGLRFIKNSVYDAPPVIPSLNTKFSLGQNLDLRLAYARGFRSPALRELYFNYFDASHSIVGNPNLKAEYSNSFNGSFVWQSVARQGVARQNVARQSTSAKDVHLKSTLGFFYNHFHNLIDYGYDPTNPSVSMTVNIDQFRTTGGTFENQLYWNNLQASVGFSYIGRYNSILDEGDYASRDLGTFLWSPEVNASLTYHFKKLGTQLGFFYKYTGKRPSYTATVDSQNNPTVRLAEIGAFHWGDVTLTKTLTKYLRLSAGAKNIFNVTRLTNSSTDVGGAHSTGGPVPMSYGRSYFAGLVVNWSKPTSH
ncbi:hypothetical protein GCM10027275_02430 [Rhabdobacter roseus]|uniref:Outer membrane receptor for ferrienterochelin and colicins n=1 Tax=Rhabdobacter roseus TaxID=1655419 RepID=A0A840TG06_9BACT|nr:TonB-dependent receptor [Rhabdobacter roseus]MBB5282131.1 outer membrane receptor for ferrienterochelin and colicins [Rhabdobacter roseus]